MSGGRARCNRKPVCTGSEGEQLKSWWEMCYSGGGLNRHPENLPGVSVMELTLDQEAEARRIFELLKGKADAELMAVARLLASKEMGEIFGRTEFEVRDHV